MDSNDEFETAERIPVLNDKPFKIVFSDSLDQIKSNFNVMDENIHLSTNAVSTKNKINIKSNKSQWLDNKYTILEIPFNYTIKGFVTVSNGFMNISIDQKNNNKNQKMFAIFFLDNLSVIDVDIIPPPKKVNWKLLLGVFFIAILFVYMMMNMITGFRHYGNVHLSDYIHMPKMSNLKNIHLSDVLSSNRKGKNISLSNIHEAHNLGYTVSPKSM